jgi:cytochrome c biogenesis protein CcmG, thiol:disulfide interchange protein DsbE
MSSPSSRASGMWLAFVVVLALAVGVAIIEFRARGTATIGGFSVANFRARAETENRPAPPIELPSLAGGGRISLGAFKGESVVLNFWASWCLPCRREAPGLQWTWEHYRSEGIQFLGVDERDNDPAGRAFTREFRVTYPSGKDPAGSLADDYELVGMPTTFIIDANGIIRYRFLGYLDRDVLQAAVEDVLSGGPT